VLKAIALFEFKGQIKRPLFWLVALVFFLLAFGATVSDSVSIGGAIGNIHRNAPSVIFRFHLILSIIALFITTTFVAGAALRDFDYKTHELIFSRPVPKLDYLLGRFLAGLGISFIVFLSVPLGMIIGSYMPWLDPQRLGPFMPQAYLFALFALALPNVLLAAAIFFVFASLSRSMFYTYLAVIGFFAAYSISLELVRDIDTRPIAAYLDPFGIAAFSNLSRYWTAVESNTLIPPLSGLLLYNRLLWLGFAVMVFVFGFLRFRFTQPAIRRSRRARKLDQEKSVSGSAPAQSLFKPVCERKFQCSTAFRQFLNQARIDIASVFKSIPFPIIIIFGLLNLIGSLFSANLIYGTNSWPVTHLMIRSITGSYLFLLVIIVTFYSGELIWRERSAGLAEVTDSMPAPNWAFLGGKLLAQIAVVCGFLIASILTTIIWQLAIGYTHLEPAVYFKGFIVMSLGFVLICFLATFFQVVSGNKFIGYLLTIIFLISTAVLESLHFDHNLYRFAGAPDAPFSDMNGYGHFVKPLFWFNLYWILAALALAAITSLLWIRGTDRSWKTRLTLVRARYQGPVRIFLPAVIVAFVLTGAFIFYNTNVLNEYIPGDAQRHRQADYEKKYRQYKDVNLPRVQDVYADVDIYPSERRVEIRGRYLVTNKNNSPLEDIHMSIPHRVKVNKLDMPSYTEKLNDKISGYRIYRLAKPLQPGEEATIRFNLTVENPGFQNNESDTSLVYNGTFFNNRQYFPSFGYLEDNELKDENERRKEHLPPYHRMAKVDDIFARRNNGLASDSDWIKFETVVSTSSDQIAVAPGYLQKEWTKDDRRYFHYKMDAPILHFYSYLSARYEVLRDKWHDVNIEIYYHKPHTYNLTRMVEGIKKSLDYFTANFGPYQHRQVRILEFPRYADFAQSFPNTIPYSESIGFIARIDMGKEDSIDFPFYVTAHEVAHQWWAHQLMGANVQGAALMSESFAQYSALMVMEKEYGPEKMRRFLKYELDSYLRGRGGELIEEVPLQLVEIQPYIYYNKGSVVMYALRDYIGENTLNQALSKYLNRYKYQQPPYTNSLEFMETLGSEAPQDKQSILDDMFRTITLFENRAEKATYSKQRDGKYVVSLKAKAKKLRANGKGVETEIPINDWIDIGVFAKEKKNGKTDQKVLYLKKRLITANDVNLEIIIDRKPERAGIDPFNKLVDRKSDDNEIDVTEQGKTQ
jgi:ABC-2 type transport system permease protein